MLMNLKEYAQWLYWYLSAVNPPALDINMFPLYLVVTRLDWLEAELEILLLAQH